MKRIDLVYDGRDYSVSGREVDELLRVVSAELRGPDASYWLEVNVGLGDPRTAFLLITAGTPFAIVPITEE